MRKQRLQSGDATPYKCATCNNWDWRDEGPVPAFAIAECKINPPTVQMCGGKASREAVWPCTDGDDWCAHWTMPA